MGGDPQQKRRIPVPAGVGKVRAGADSCDLTFTVDLIGVRREATEGIRRGDILTVDLEGDARKATVVCKTDGKKIVGGLAAFEGLATLLSCMTRGTEYQAVVQRVGATHCTVTVTRVGR